MSSITTGDRVFWAGAPEVIGTVLNVVHDENEQIAEVSWDAPGGYGRLNVVQLSLAEDNTSQALKGAAEFFETVATGANPAPLAFSQAIRGAMAREAATMAALKAMVAAVFAPNEPGSPTLTEAAEMARDVFG